MRDPPFGVSPAESSMRLFLAVPAAAVLLLAACDVPPDAELPPAPPRITESRELAPDRPPGDADPGCDGVCGSCAEVIASDPAAGSGVTLVAPGGGATIPVLCDMTTQAGGWTLIQRTVWDPAATDSLMTGFDDWEGQGVGALQSGVYRLPGARWPHLAPDREILLRLVLRSAGDAPCAPLHYVATFEELSVAGGIALIEGVTADVPMLFNAELSTLDSGPSIAACIERFDAVPWFYGSCCVTCPAAADAVDDGERHPLVVEYPASVDDADGLRFGNVCPSGAVLEAGGVFGVDVMEFWLR